MAYKDAGPEPSTKADFWSSRYVLFVEDLSVSFDGFKAVDIPYYGVKHGELRVIIGPNGAGKSTFCDLVSGKTRPSTGKVFLIAVRSLLWTNRDRTSWHWSKISDPTVFR